MSNVGGVLHEIIKEDVRRGFLSERVRERTNVGRKRETSGGE